MENILSQIPQSIVEKYGINVNADKTVLFVSLGSHFIGFLNSEIKFREDDITFTIEDKNCVFHMWKKVYSTHMTILK